MPNRPPLTVLISNSELLREGITRILVESKFPVDMSAAHLDKLPKKQFTGNRPILIIMDIDSNEITSTLSQIEKFRIMQKTSRIVVLADQHKSEYLVSCLRAGVDAFLTKGTAYDAFIESLDLVARGHIVLPGAALSYFQERFIEPNPEERQIPANTVGSERGNNDVRLSACLSTRERSILQYLVRGESNKVIARSVNITEATVKVHVKTILRKIRVHNRTQAAVWAINNPE